MSQARQQLAPFHRLWKYSRNDPACRSEPSPMPALAKTALLTSRHHTCCFHGECVLYVRYACVNPCMAIWYREKLAISKGYELLLSGPMNRRYLGTAAMTSC